jgi:hypothetical protein
MFQLPTVPPIRSELFDCMVETVLTHLPEYRIGADQSGGNGTVLLGLLLGQYS